MGGRSGWTARNGSHSGIAELYTGKSVMDIDNEITSSLYIFYMNSIISNWKRNGVNIHVLLFVVTNSITLILETFNIRRIAFEFKLSCKLLAVRNLKPTKDKVQVRKTRILIVVQCFNKSSFILSHQRITFKIYS